MSPSFCQFRPMCRRWFNGQPRKPRAQMDPRGQRVRVIPRAEQLEDRLCPSSLLPDLALSGWVDAHLSSGSRIAITDTVTNLGGAAFGLRGSADPIQRG